MFGRTDISNIDFVILSTSYGERKKRDTCRQEKLPSQMYFNDSEEHFYSLFCESNENLKQTVCDIKRRGLKKQAVYIVTTAL
jgi:hypothetical protein